MQLCHIIDSAFTEFMLPSGVCWICYLFLSSQLKLKVELTGADTLHFISG